MEGIQVSRGGLRRWISSTTPLSWFQCTWECTGALPIDIKKKAITYYDSMGGNNLACLRALTDYVKDEHLAKKGKALDMSSWKQVVAKEIPQQMNGSDCGMFTCKFAEYLSRRARITFSQKDMPYFRRRMVYEIVENTLLHP